MTLLPGGAVDEARRAGLAAVDALSAPIQHDTLGSWLAQLNAQTARRGSDEVSETLLSAMYMELLGDYPADAVCAALWPDPLWKFWPTWAELKTKLDDAMAARRCVEQALVKGAIEDPSAPPPEKKAPTPEERAYAVEHANGIRDAMIAREEAQRTRHEWPRRDETTMAPAEKLALWDARLGASSAGLLPTMKDVELHQLRTAKAQCPSLMTRELLTRLAELEEWERGLN